LQQAGETPGQFVAFAPGDGEHGNPPGKQFGGDGLSQAAGVSCQYGFHDRFPLNGELGRILRLNRPNATVGSKKRPKSKSAAGLQTWLLQP